MDDVLEQLQQLERSNSPGNDDDFVPRTYEEVVADRAERRRLALEERRAAATKETGTDIVDEPKVDTTYSSPRYPRQTKRMSGAEKRRLTGRKQHSGAYFRRLRKA